jgi:hypothetical protein
MAVKTVKAKGPSTKNVGKNSGRSMSSEYPTGKRRVSEGKELAPTSLRKKGKRYLSECTESELEKLGLN